LTVIILTDDPKQIFKDFRVVAFLDFGTNEFAHREDYATRGATVYSTGQGYEISCLAGLNV
jgi:hypothetical protein